MASSPTRCGDCEVDLPVNEGQNGTYHKAAGFWFGLFVAVGWDVLGFFCFVLLLLFFMVYLFPTSVKKLI